MKKNKITVIINKSVDEVFQFTTNPKNTHLRVPSISKEVSTEYPPKINTEYKNHGEDGEWDFYRVTEYQENKIFTLSDLDANYSVRYTYRKIDDQETEMEYFEWMNDGELSNPFTEDILINLKVVMEKS